MDFQGRVLACDAKEPPGLQNDSSSVNDNDMQLLINAALGVLQDARRP